VAEITSGWTHVTADGGRLLQLLKEKEIERKRKNRDLFFVEAKYEVPFISDLN